MKYIAVDKTAANSIVSMRHLQSTEYEEGRQLVSVLQNGITEDAILYDIGIMNLKDGVGFVGTSPDYAQVLIVDLDCFTAFSECNAADALGVFQKTCRVALKYWEKIPFSGREFLKSDKDLIVLIPKKISIGDGSKVLIDIKPDWSRQDKRGTHHLLVFHYGLEMASEKASVTNFRKGLDQVKDASVNCVAGNDNCVAPFYVEKLGDEFKPIDSNTSFDTWRNLLTSSQSNFVFRKNHGPERIEGAAGTGKTLSLSLRCCNVLTEARIKGDSLKVAFLTHSHASKEYIESIIFPKLDWYDPSDKSKYELVVVTLQEWCIASLGNKIEETELLDKDAQNSKDYQQLLILDVLNDFKGNQFSSHAKFISDELQEYFLHGDGQLQIQSLQYEIAEIIKGRSSQDLSKYKKTSYIGHSIPLKSDADFECIYSLYVSYQNKLESTGYFDSDDVILSALGQLDSPIWRRRKNIEGFDVLFIDETHLFNLNELSIIHHLLKDKCVSSIIYSVDRSQSLANISLDARDLDEVFGNDENSEVSLKTVFRSSPDIVKLAFSVLSSGSTLFTNMENPLDKVEGSFTAQEESRSKKPYCVECDSDEDVISRAFQSADRLAKDISSKRSKILIIASTDIVLSNLERYSTDQNKPTKFIKKRGDKKSQIDAEKGNQYILSGIDYVGGLEFDGVVIVGVDKGHMPATEENGIDAKHFLNHASYNRLYVAITRAKFGVSVLYSSARGVSKILDFPISEETIDILA